MFDRIISAYEKSEDYRRSWKCVRGEPEGRGYRPLDTQTSNTEPIMQILRRELGALRDEEIGEVESGEGARMRVLPKPASTL